MRVKASWSHGYRRAVPDPRDQQSPRCSGSMQAWGLQLRGCFRAKDAAFESRQSVRVAAGKGDEEAAGNSGPSIGSGQHAFPCGPCVLFGAASCAPRSVLFSSAPDLGAETHSFLRA
jgi:hypothetical protein